MKKTIQMLLLVTGMSGTAFSAPVGPPGGAPILNQNFLQVGATFYVPNGVVTQSLKLPYLVPGLCQTTDSTGKVINTTCGGSGGASSLAVNSNGVQVTSPTVAINAVSPIIVTAVSGGTTAQFSLDASSVTLFGPNVLRLSNVLIPGTTVYASSATFTILNAGNLVANSANFPNGLTSNGTILGTGQLQIYGVTTLFGPVYSSNYGYTMPDGTIMTSTKSFVWNGSDHQPATMNIDSATVNTQLSVPFLTAGRCITTDSSGHLINVVCGGAASIAISTGGVIVSSPTPQIDLNASQFIAGISGTTTTVALNGSSVTLQGNTVNLSALQTQANAIAVDTETLSVSTSALQSKVNAIATDTGTLSTSTTSLQSQINGKGPGTITGVIAGTGLSGGGVSSNVTLNNTGVLSVSSTTSGGTAINGAIYIVPGSNITESISGSTLTISASGGSGSPGGSSGQIQFNNGGSFGGVPDTNVTGSQINISTISISSETVSSALNVGTNSDFFGNPLAGMSWNNSTKNLDLEGTLVVDTAYPVLGDIKDTNGNSIVWKYSSGGNSVGYPGVNVNVGTGMTQVGYIAVPGGLGDDNTTAVGYGALGKHVGGTSIGALSFNGGGSANGSSSANTVVGYNAWGNNNMGFGLMNDNTVIGSNILPNPSGNPSLVGLTLVGAQTGNPTTSSLFNATALGYHSQVITSSTVVLGSTMTPTNVLIGESSPTVRSNLLEVNGNIGIVGSGGLTGAGLTSCSGGSNALTWNSSTNQFGCNTISGSGGISGTINAAAQFSLPYYSLMGSSTSLSAFPGVTASTNTGVTISTLIIGGFSAGSVISDSNGKLIQGSQQTIYLTPSFTSTDEHMIFYASVDGKTWSAASSESVNPTNPFRDGSIIKYNGIYYVVHSETFNSAPPYPSAFQIDESTDLINWSNLTSVTIDPSGVYAPEWFVDSSGLPYIFSWRVSDGKIVWVQATNSALTTYTSTQTIAGLPSSLLDPFIVKANGLYYLWYADSSSGKQFIEYSTSTSLTSGYSQVKTGDWNNWHSGLEGPSIVQTGPSSYTLYVDSDGAGWYMATSTNSMATWSTMSLASSIIRHSSPLTPFTAPNFTYDPTIYADELRALSAGRRFDDTSTAIGQNAIALGAASFAAGNGAQAINDCVAVGPGAACTTSGGVALGGASTFAIGTNAVAIGVNAQAFTGQTLIKNAQLTLMGGLGTSNLNIWASSATFDQLFVAPSENITYGLTATTATFSGLVINSSNTILSGTTFYQDGSVYMGGLSASLPVQTDAAKKLVSSAINLSGSQATGTLAAGRFPALTGDITTSAGSLATTAAAKQSNIKTLSASSTTITGNSEIDGWTIHKASVSIIGTLSGAGLAAGSFQALQSNSYSISVTSNAVLMGQMLTCTNNDTTINWSGETGHIPCGLSLGLDQSTSHNPIIGYEGRVNPSGQAAQYDGSMGYVDYQQQNGAFIPSTTTITGVDVRADMQTSGGVNISSGGVASMIIRAPNGSGLSGQNAGIYDMSPYSNYFGGHMYVGPVTATAYGNPITWIGDIAPSFQINTNGNLSQGLLLQSGNDSNYTFMQIGRGGSDFTFAASAGSGQFFSDSQSGDAIIRDEHSTNALRLGAGTASSTLQINSSSATFTAASGVYFATGTATFFNEYQTGSYVNKSTITWSNGNDQNVVLTANTTFVFNAPGTGVNLAAQLNLDIDTGAGTFTSSWPASVKWADGTSGPTTTTGGKLISCTFHYIQKYGDYVGQCAQAITP